MPGYFGIATGCVVIIGGRGSMTVQWSYVASVQVVRSYSLDVPLPHSIFDPLLCPSFIRVLGLRVKTA